MGACNELFLCAVQPRRGPVVPGEENEQTLPLSQAMNLGATIGKMVGGWP